ncbi:MAG: hypothetical protein SFW67_10820 [Myxococcaceae bacterium]|nr:hypothetical protein [Myxococcaceae bacterium]
MRASASLFGLLVASSALAQEGLEYGFGTGRLGNVSASTLSVFNQCSGVRALAGVSVDLDSAVGFAAGDLVLFHHTQGVADAGVVDFGQSTVGRYFFRRLVAVSGDRVTLDRPAELLTEGVVQAVRVIEARQLFVRYTRSIVSPSWNGRCGGIIAALVS